MKAAIGKRVTVVDDPDRRLEIRYRGVELAYRTFDKIRQVSQAPRSSRTSSSVPRSPSSASSVIPACSLVRAQKSGASVRKPPTSDYQADIARFRFTISRTVFLLSPNSRLIRR
jgi:hypothetical protein